MYYLDFALVHHLTNPIQQLNIPMDFNQFTIKTQEVLQTAQQLAEASNHPSIENAHLLKGVFQEDKDVVPFILRQSQVDQTTLERALESILTSMSKVSGGQLMLGQKAQQTLNQAIQLSKQQGDEYVSV